MFLSPKKQRKISIKKEKLEEDADSIVFDLTGDVAAAAPTTVPTTETKTRKRILKKSSSDESSVSESSLPLTIPIDLSTIESPLGTKASRKKKNTILTEKNDQNNDTIRDKINDKITDKITRDKDNDNLHSNSKTAAQTLEASWSYTSDPLLTSLRDTLFVFTDGSCPKNNRVADRFENPAGWSYVAVRPTHSLLQSLHETHRLVQSETRAALMRSDSDALSQFVKDFLRDNMSGECVDRGFGPVFFATNGSVRHVSLGASVGSNNTGELSAFLEAFLYLLNHCPLLFNRPSVPKRPIGDMDKRQKTDKVDPDAADGRVRRVVLCYDSEYAAKSITGQFNGKKNTELIDLGRKLLYELEAKLTQVNVSRDTAPVASSVPMSTLLDQHLSLNAMRKSYTSSVYNNSKNSDNSNSSSSDSHRGRDTGRDTAVTGPVVVMAHVRAHSNHYWNDMADTLALRGAEGSLLKSARFQNESTESLGQFLLINDDSRIF